MQSSEFNRFGKVAFLYDALNRGARHEDTARLVLHHLGDAKNGRVIEWGAGTGLVSRHVGRVLADRLIATDRDFVMAQYLRERHSKTRTACAMESYLSFADACYAIDVVGYVTASETRSVNEHAAIDPLDKFLANSHRHLSRNRGRLIFDFVHALAVPAMLKECEVGTVKDTHGAEWKWSVKRIFHASTCIIESRWAFESGRGGHFTDEHRCRAFTEPEIVAALHRGGFTPLFITGLHDINDSVYIGAHEQRAFAVADAR